MTIQHARMGNDMIDWGREEEQPRAKARLAWACVEHCSVYRWGTGL